MADAVTTTDEAAFLAAICAAPGDDAPRLIYADWLEERAGTVACGRCKGTGSIGAYRGFDPYGIVRREIDCPTCSGTGRVSDGRAEYAAFIRDCCQILARHTDCPQRLFDAKYYQQSNPLRCGQCDYCQARRRAERYYARHRWVEGIPYAVAFEPTPLDGDMPTGPGLTLIVRRGFVESVTADLATLFGGPCHGCIEPGELDDGDPRCKTCDGTGRSPGIVTELWSRQPVTRCVIVDREPWENDEGFWQWYDGDRQIIHPVHPQSDLPRSLWNLLDARARGPQKDYPSRSDAINALSAAAVALGRKLAGLA